MDLKFEAITTNRVLMDRYLVNEFCLEVFQVFEQYYPKIGFHFPWIGYFVLYQDKVIGVGGFKGAPKDKKVEIAYGVIPEMEGKGFASQICKELIKIALSEDSEINVTARTLMEESASTSILKKNGFQFVGIVEDLDDGFVWEWELKRNPD